MALQWLTDPNITINGRMPDDIYINGTKVAHFYKNVKVTVSDHSMKMFANHSEGVLGEESDFSGCSSYAGYKAYRNYYMDVVTGVCIKVETDTTQTDGLRVEKIKISHATAIKDYNYDILNANSDSWGSFEWYPAANDILATADITQEKFNELYNTYGQGLPTDYPYVQVWKNCWLWRTTGSTINTIPTEDWTQKFYTRGWLNRVTGTIYFTDGTTGSFDSDPGFQAANFYTDTFFQGTMCSMGTWSK